MRDGGQPDRPAILVISARADAVEREVLAGIEEEGVPYLVESPQDGDCARALAVRAAARSSLSVGVGIDRTGRVCVQHQKLVDQLPELSSAGAADAGRARLLGHVAARIVVGIPLPAEKIS